MNRFTHLALAVVFSSATAFAQSAPARVATTTPAKAAPVVLKCPAGTRQVGGPNTPFEASLCMRSTLDGARIFHGPYVAFWPNGVKQAEGQYDEGLRAGAWVFFDEKGVKTGETSFKLDSYDGLRVEYFPTGQKRLEETYVMGKRQGTQRTWDEAGEGTLVDFRDDRPVSAPR